MTEENYIKSEYFGGMDFLKRLDKLLIAFNHSSIQNDIHLMYDCIHSFFEEISPYMNEDELKDNKDKAEQYFKDIYEADKEQTENSKLMSNSYNPYKRPKLNYTKLVEVKQKIRCWRMDLQKIQKKYGLLMKDVDDPAAAMQRGLAD